MTRTLLFDTDIVAYQAAALNQNDSPFGRYSYWEQAKRTAVERIEDIAEKLAATDLIMCLTHAENFRYGVLPTYKQTRDRSKDVRPELLAELKEFLADEYPSYIRPGLEADDIMGLLATHPSIVPGDKIIVSEDKDMRTVSGKVYNPRNPDLGVLEISPQDAAAFHMWQTICGDPTDGYKGAPGIGKSSIYAEDILHCDMHEMWDEVLMAYAQVGLGEVEALKQAQVAKILSRHLYDFKTKEVVLWTPEHLTGYGMEIY